MFSNATIIDHHDYRYLFISVGNHTRIANRKKKTEKLVAPNQPKKSTRPPKLLSSNTAPRNKKQGTGDVKTTNPKKKSEKPTASSQRKNSISSPKALPPNAAASKKRQNTNDTGDTTTQPPKKRRRKSRKLKRNNIQAASIQNSSSVPQNVETNEQSTEGVLAKQNGGKKKGNAADKKSAMKERLEGARFRYLNEMLYTTSSKVGLMVCIVQLPFSCQCFM